MYKNILLAVALQGSEVLSSHALAARDVAISMATSGSKPVYVLTIYNLEKIDGHHEPLPTLADFKLGQTPQDQEERKHEIDHIMRVEEQVHSTMDHFVVEFHNRGIDTRNLVKQENPRQLIIETAREIGADLIIIGSHARRSFLDVLKITGW